MVLLSVGAFAQMDEALRPVDLGKIKKLVTKEKSDFYYPDLYVKILSGRETLSDDEYHYLYYGYSFTDYYHPDHAQSADSLLRAIEEMNLDTSQLLLIQQRCENLLQTCVIDPDLLFVKYYVLYSLGYKVKAKLWLAHFKGIVKTIKDSGRLDDCGGAVTILYRHHSRFIGEILDRDVLEDYHHDEDCMHVSWLQQEAGEEPMYFDVSLILENEEEWAKGKEVKRKIELADLLSIY